MKKLVFLVLVLLIVGCAHSNEPYDYASDPRYPPGKTDVDFEKDELECRNMSGKATGAWGLTLPGIINNAGGANAKYNECMKAKGWYKNE